MSRPLYFTGRKEILRTDVSVHLICRSGKSPQFKACFDLSRYRLPPDASIVVEAYHNAYLRPFDCGTVKDHENERVRELSDLESDDVPAFRIKVIDRRPSFAGRLLAAIDRIEPRKDGARDSSMSLLAILQKEMGGELWQVGFEESGAEICPQLWVNRAATGLYESLQRQDPKVVALVMPEVLRQLLYRTTEEQMWTEEGILGQWLRFAQSLGATEFDHWDDGDPETSRRERREWVDDVVSQFAEKHRFVEMFSASLSDRDDQGADDARD